MNQLETELTSSLKIELQNNSDHRPIPYLKDFSTWALSAVNGSEIELTSRLFLNITLVDKSQSAKLNHHYRKKLGPTNILSFPADTAMKNYLLGDLIICAPLVTEEAQSQEKNSISHWAHLTVHGVLHLLGYNHENLSEAATMETLEINILRQLGIADPYEIRR